MEPPAKLELSALPSLTPETVGLAIADPRVFMAHVAVAMTQGDYPPAECPVEHTFTPGLYCRTIFKPKGSLIVSKIHNTTHPFQILAGKVSVWLPETGWQMLEAPYRGITTPGTQRLLEIHEDTLWSTFHVTDETDPEKIVEQITIPFDPVALLQLKPEEIQL